MENSSDPIEDDNCKEASAPSGMDPKKKKPPNKKKFEEEMEMVNTALREKEAELKSLSTPADENITAELRNIRAEKDASIEKRKKIDAELKKINQDLTQKMGSLSKLQSNLSYKNEDKINEAIKRLEWQLKMQNFKLSEEKKIVAEIDSLKRSKKVLSQYNTFKKEIDDMRDRQRRMREEKDHYYRHVTQLKSREEGLKRRNVEKRGKVQVLKQEIEELNEKKKKMSIEFKKLEKDFQDTKEVLRKRHREESFKRKEEEKKAMFQNLRKEKEQSQSLAEPFSDERNLCNALLMYLQRFQASSGESDPGAQEQSTGAAQSTQPSLADSLDDGMYVLLKKTEDIEYCGIAKRNSRRNSKKRRQSYTKPINHSPQIFAQFASLTLSAPSSAMEIPASIEQLQARKRYYEEMAAKAGTSKFLSQSLTASTMESASILDLSFSDLSLSLSMREHPRHWQLPGSHPPLPEDSMNDCSGSSICDGYSATESFCCEMSRQASKTESSGSGTEVTQSDQVLEELILLSNSSVQNVCEENQEAATVQVTVSGDDTDLVEGGDRTWSLDSNDQVLMPPPNVTVAKDIEADVLANKSDPSYCDPIIESAHGQGNIVTDVGPDRLKLPNDTTLYLCVSDPSIEQSSVRHLDTMISHDSGVEIDTDTECFRKRNENGQIMDALIECHQQYFNNQNTGRQCQCHDCIPDNLDKHLCVLSAPEGITDDIPEGDADCSRHDISLSLSNIRNGEESVEQKYNENDKIEKWENSSIELQVLQEIFNEIKGGESKRNKLSYSTDDGS